MPNKTPPTRPPRLSFIEAVWPDIAEMEILIVQASGRAINKAAVWRIEDILELAECRALSDSALQAFLLELQTPPSADGDDGYD